MFHLSREQARGIVATCPSCQIYQIPSLYTGVHPRGLTSGQLWQVDATHIPEFGRLKYVHVAIDMFSHVIYVVALTGEKAKDAIKHLIMCFSIMGVPQRIKTDNGPAYVSDKFKSFLKKWGIEHTAGIPYSPTGQAIVERAHQTLKRVLQQQQGGTEENTPIECLCKALFTINFLNKSSEELLPPVFQHFSNSTKAEFENHLPVLLKDPESNNIFGPFPLIVWGRGYGCVSTPQGDSWVPSKYIKPYHISQSPFQNVISKNQKDQATQTISPVTESWQRQKKKDTENEDNGWSSLPFPPGEESPNT